MKKPTSSMSVSGVITDCRSSWRETSDAGGRERGGVERVADHEPDERETGGDQDVAVDVQRARRRRRLPRPSTASSSSCPSPSRPSPRILPASRCSGLMRGEQQLDDARALLLHDAHGHEVADADQLAVEQQDGEEGEAAALVGVRVDRLDRRHPQRRRPQRRGGLPARRARRRAAPRRCGPRAFAAWRMLTSVVVGLLLRGRSSPSRSVASAPEETIVTLASNAPAPRTAASATGARAGSPTAIL